MVSEQLQATTALEARGVQINYLVVKHHYTSLKEFALAALKGNLKKANIFTALDQVGFCVRRGETVGLIGRNGSGKSTLLKACAGIISPAQGQIIRRGSLTSLIELGAGFDSELSAEENIYLSCMLMGFDRRLISESVDRIFEFAELEDFRKFPVKTFSSGMYARLGFACATLIDADIILIDEVLAVGDEAFQLKCLKHMQALKDSGRSIVFVSHDLGTVQSFCDRVYVLEAGQVAYEGDPKTGVDKLRSLLLPEKHVQVIGDLSRGLDIQVQERPNVDLPDCDLILDFTIARNLEVYDWKLQIFGFGQQKPLLMVRPDDVKDWQHTGSIDVITSDIHNLYRIKFRRFPLQGGEFMAYLTLLESGAEIAHVARGFRFYPNQVVNHEERGILNLSSVFSSSPQFQTLV
jgi:ABC-type polysaccharide/polyol phosphate transport system ATPase subunit